MRRAWLCIFILLIVGGVGCKEKQVTQPMGSTKVDFSRSLNLMDTNPKSQLGLFMQVAEWKLDIFVFGDKNTQGILKKANQLFFFNPANHSWMLVDITNQLPQKITTHTGTIVEFQNYQRAGFSADILVKNPQGQTIQTLLSFKLSERFFSDFDNMAKALLQNGARKAAIQESECQKTKKLAQAIGFGANALSCALGAMAIAESAGIALIFDGISLLTACYNALATLVNAKSKGALPEFSCTQNGVIDGIGLAGLLSGQGALNTPGIVAAAASAAAGASDFNACTECPPEEEVKGKSKGDPHIVTHDGQDYAFQVIGEFVAVRGDGFEVQSRQEDAYQTNQATVNTAVAARLGTDVICFLLNPADLSKPRLFVNKKEVTLTNSLQLTLSEGNLLTLTQPEKLIFTNSQGEGVKIYWNTPYLDYAVALSENRKGKVTGLMGNYDGNENNDFQLPNQEFISPTFPNIHQTFANSWRITNQNSLFVYDAGKTTESYTNKNFPKAPAIFSNEKIEWATQVCKNAGVTRQPELGNCIYDVAVTGDTRMAKSAVLSQKEFNAAVDIRYFKNLKIDIKEQQSLTDANLTCFLDADNGLFYSLKDGANAAYDVDLIFEQYSGPIIGGARALKNCGVSCGAYNLWPTVEKQQWPTFTNTFIRYTSIPANQWENYQSSADLQKAWTFDSQLSETGELMLTLYDVNTYALKSQYLWAFRTQQGKVGLMRITSGSVEKNSRTTFTFEIKVEK